MADNTVEVKLGSKIEISFIEMSNVDDFFIENCTAMDSSELDLSADSLALAENGCKKQQTDPVLSQIDPKISSNGRQLAFNQFAFAKKSLFLKSFLIIMKLSTKQ